MLIVVGLVALAILCSYGIPSVHQFFEPSTQTSSRKRSASWMPHGPRKMRRLPSSGDFWAGLGQAVERDPTALCLVPRNEGARPLNGFNQAWIPGEALAGPWLLKQEDATESSARHGLRPAYRRSSGSAL